MMTGRLSASHHRFLGGVLFFRDLFDPSFSRFVTKRIAGVIWVLFLVLITLSVLGGWLLLVLSAGSVSDMPFQSKVIWVASWPLIPIVALIAVIAARLSFESAIALTVIAQNTGNRPMVVETASRVETTTEIATSEDFSGDELEVLIEDFDTNASAFVREVIGSEGYRLWIKAGSPDLKPWIRAGMPDFERWLSGR